MLQPPPRFAKKNKHDSSTTCRRKQKLWLRVKRDRDAIIIFHFDTKFSRLKKNTEHYTFYRTWQNYKTTNWINQTMEPVMNTVEDATYSVSMSVLCCISWISTMCRSNGSFGRWIANTASTTCCNHTKHRYKDVFKHNRTSTCRLLYMEMEIWKVGC